MFCEPRARRCSMHDLRTQAATLCLLFQPLHGGNSQRLTRTRSACVPPTVRYSLRARLWPP
eukprot:6193255-Pleurochrysis_carterae.AAC.1